MNAILALLGGSIILMAVLSIISIIILAIGIWFFIGKIKLMKYALWKAKNDYSYQHRK